MSEQDLNFIAEIKKEYEYFKDKTPEEKAMYIGMYLKDKLNNIQKE